MKPRAHTLALAALSLAAAVVGYEYAGFWYLKSRSTLVLVDYCIFPEHRPKVWFLAPISEKICLSALEAKAAAQVRADFQKLQATLYSGGIGYHDIYGRPLTAAQKSVAKTLTASLFRTSGIQMNQEWVDSIGCTAVHQALIEHDKEAAEFLIQLGRVSGDLQNPRASTTDCRLPLRDLAASKGVHVNFWASPES